ncbi:hypothetical protein GW17_00000711 [Ensete ventricosum]|nr:hypothetical protein GW17_00000711 [Ensete ventricosum]
MGGNRESRARLSATESWHQVGETETGRVAWGRTGIEEVFPIRRYFAPFDRISIYLEEEEMATMLRSLAARRYLWSSSSLARSYSSHQHPALVGKSFTRTPSRRIHPISGYRYADCPLSGGSAKNRPSVVDFGRRRPIEEEIDCRRSIEEEEEKKKKRSGEYLARALSSPAGRLLTVVARGSTAVAFSLVRGDGASPRAERKIEAMLSWQHIPDCSSPFVFRLRRAFSCNVNQLPGIADPDIEAAFKDLMAMNWDEIPDSVTHNTKKSLSKATGDKTGQEALANAFRAAEASAEFSGILVSLRMALDDLSGISGEVC